MSLKFNALVPPFDLEGTSSKKLEEELALYFKLAGRATAQTAIFGTGAGAEGRLESTSNATKGKILIGSSAYEESKNFLGIGTKTPTAILQVTGTAAAAFQAAPFALKVEGPAGGIAVEEEHGGEGAGASIVCGKGGASTVVGFVGVGGQGGGGTFTGGAGGSSTGVNTQENQGGEAKGFTFQAGTGGAASGSSATNLGGRGGPITFTGGNGGNAEGASGIRKGGNGGEILLLAGSGGTGASGGGEGGGLTLEAGTSGGTLAGGKLILKAGQGSGATAGGPYRVSTYKEGTTVGGEMEITAAGEYLFKNETSKTRMTIAPAGTVTIENNVVAPIEILAGKTYEVPSNIQGLFKENISVQGILNIQGRFDEVYTIEPESVETAQIRNGAVTEAKAELPEMVKLTGIQTITGLKTFTETKVNKLKAESLTLEGTKEVGGVSTLTLSEGTFALTEERLALGTAIASALKQLKFSGTIENSGAFEEATQDCAYAVIPEGGAAVLESAKPGTTKHRAVFLVNVSTTETLTIVHEGKGLGANKFHFASGENVKLEPGQTITLWYTEGEASGAAARWRDLSGASLNLRSFTNGIPTEIAAGKTYEVPATIQDLWKDNVSVQGTLNVQGHFDEVGVTEGSPWFLPFPVSPTMNVPVPANTQTWFTTETNIEGSVNVQGQLKGIN